MMSIKEMLTSFFNSYRDECGDTPEIKRPQNMGFHLSHENLLEQLLWGRVNRHQKCPQKQQVGKYTSSGVFKVLWH